MTDEMQPLAADAKRQATDIFQGYVYQAWESLHAWINLEDGEILYLEGAEDIDLLSTSSSTTTQVKHLSKNITLRSAEVIKAIIDYWTLKKNDQRHVIFRFFTTAARGQEQGNPFSGQRGLDYWEHCKNSNQVKPLRKFLKQIDGFPTDLVEYLKTATDQEILDNLVLPISWLTERDSLSALRKSIEDLLIVHGDKHSLKADESKKTAPLLFDTVLKTVCKKEIKERSLSKADFIREFEALTTTPVSKGELELLRNAASQLTAIVLSQGNLIPPNPGGNTIDTKISAPHIPDRKLFVTRKSLKQTILGRLKTLDVLAITGSSGMGKSILSLQAVEAERNNWERISFRGIKSEYIKAIINGLCNTDAHAPQNIILDDINFGQDYAIYADTFEQFVLYLRSHGKKIIVTSQKKIPSSLASRLGLNTNNELHIPVFTTEEIKELLQLNDCPQSELNLWIKDLEFTTKSHPQLVHARIRRLKEEGWDKSKIIFKTEELSAVKRETVSNLDQELPSPEARDLLLRLSVLSGSFKQKNAIALAAYPTSIKTPAIFFNQLVGPYVEQITEEYFSLSPLLDNSSQGNFSEQEIKNLHALAGESYLSKTLVPRDLSNIFLHGLASGSGRILSFAFAAFQSIDNKHKALIYPYLEWLAVVHIGTNKPAISQDEILNLMFRFIQFTIAVETKDMKSALAVADAWFNDAKNFTAKGPFQKQKEAKFFPFMFFLSVFRYESLNIPIEKCVEWILAAYDFLDKNPEINSIFKQPWGDPKTSWAEIIPEVAITKRINSSNIEGLMSALDKFPDSQKLIDAINTDSMLSKRVVDNVWLDQIDKDKPDWEEALIALEKIQVFFAKKKALSVSALAVRAIAIIKNEYTNDKAGAEQAISAGKKELGELPELINYHAKMAFINKDFSLALKRWKEVLPKLAKKNYLTAAFAYRDAAVAFANLNDWKTASTHFLEASELAKRQNEKLYATQCLADYGFSLWKLGKYEKCIDIFVHVIETLPKLPSPKTNLRSLGLLKMTSNTLIYFQKNINPEYRSVGLDYVEPVAGSHSPTDFSEKLRELPITPPETLLSFLAEVEVELQVKNNAFNKLMNIFDTLPILFQAETKKVEIVRSLKSGNLDKLVEDIIYFFTLTQVSIGIENRHIAMRKISSQDIQEALKTHGATIAHTLAFTLLSFLTSHTFEEVPWSKWEASGKKLGLDKYKEWVDFVQEAPTMTTEKARHLIQDGTADVALRAVAAIHILTQDDDRKYSLYASALLTSSLKDFSIFCWTLDDYLVDLLIKRWTNLAGHLFATWHDQESKDVLDACKDSTVEGIKKAAQITLAASEITSLNIDSVKEKLIDIIKN